MESPPSVNQRKKVVRPPLKPEGKVSCRCSRNSTCKTPACRCFRKASLCGPICGCKSNKCSRNLRNLTLASTTAGPQGRKIRSSGPGLQQRWSRIDRRERHSAGSQEEE